MRFAEIKQNCLDYVKDVLMMQFFKVRVGGYYMLQDGTAVKIEGRYYGLRGYETVVGCDGRHRYDRSTHSSDVGRCTGTDHGYSYPFNLAQPIKEIDRATYLALKAEPMKKRLRYEYEKDCA